jgi:hypothetical protein
MNNHVYHFTDTARLPWIIETGELQPGSNRIGGFPADLLWATTNNESDLTSSVASLLARKTYRQHVTQLVRITLRASDFSPWRAIIGADPAWTPNHVRQLEKAAEKLGELGIEAWRCRPIALPLTRAIAFHAKAYSVGRWVEMDATTEYCIDTGVAGQRGFVIGEYAYLATKSVNSLGLVAYGDLQRQGVCPASAPTLSGSYRTVPTTVLIPESALSGRP